MAALYFIFLPTLQLQVIRHCNGRDARPTRAKWCSNVFTSPFCITYQRRKIPSELAFLIASAVPFKLIAVVAILAADTPILAIENPVAIPVAALCM